tara:strand:+ start:2290 stop:2469 length:180 start_codon:yes stop_codon:yes gene_type:complete
MIDEPQETITVQAGETDRMIIDGTKVTIDTGNNYLDFLFVFGGILILYLGKKLIDRWLK